jgi:hypothetical protein
MLTVYAIHDLKPFCFFFLIEPMVVGIQYVLLVQDKGVDITCQSPTSFDVSSLRSYSIREAYSSSNSAIEIKPHLMQAYLMQVG